MPSVSAAHPSAWPFSGYNEIQNPRETDSLIDYESLMDLLNIKSTGELKEAYRGWVEEKQECERPPRWTESIAVGSEAFVEKTKEILGIRAPGGKVIGENGNCEPREAEVIYEPNLGLKNSRLSPENTYYWDRSV
jgi:putative transposase